MSVHNIQVETRSVLATQLETLLSQVYATFGHMSTEAEVLQRCCMSLPHVGPALLILSSLKGVKKNLETLATK